MDGALTGPRQQAKTGPTTHIPSLQRGAASPSAHGLKSRFRSCAGRAIGCRRGLDETQQSRTVSHGTRSNHVKGAALARRDTIAARPDVDRRAAAQRLGHPAVVRDAAATRAVDHAAARLAGPGRRRRRVWPQGAGPGDAQARPRARQGLLAARRDLGLDAAPRLTRVVPPAICVRLARDHRTSVPPRQRRRRDRRRRDLRRDLRRGLRRGHGRSGELRCGDIRARTRRHAEPKPARTPEPAPPRVEMHTAKNITAADADADAFTAIRAIVGHASPPPFSYLDRPRRVRPRK